MHRKLSQTVSLQPALVEKEQVSQSIQVKVKPASNQHEPNQPANSSQRGSHGRRLGDLFPRKKCSGKSCFETLQADLQTALLGSCTS
mmetsp:Transcript_70308/g.129573  ORF Transcript_70308/g.129573 Transcript_70308/m.129573 type:complete len:87 (-) Transcript_70308:51-311(-)